ncbi:hypothetical protein GGU45_004083 [Niabella hirudinis]
MTRNIKPTTPLGPCLLRICYPWRSQGLCTLYPSGTFRMDTVRAIRYDLNPEDVSNYLNHFQEMCPHDRINRE